MTRRAFLAAIAGTAVAPKLLAVAAAEIAPRSRYVRAGPASGYEERFEIKLRAQLTNGEYVAFCACVGREYFLTARDPSEWPRKLVREMQRALRNVCDQTGAEIVGEAHLTTHREFYRRPRLDPARLPA